MHLKELIRQKPYEKIVYTIRRHWITYIPTVLLFLLLAILPVGVYILISDTAPALLEEQYPRAFLYLMFSVYELLIAMIFYSTFLMYYLDLLIITNDRLVQIQQKTLFSRSVSELDLYKIQDASSSITGVVPTIFGYGNISIQTAGDQNKFSFDAVPHVNVVRRELMQLAEEDRKYHIKSGTLGD